MKQSLRQIAAIKESLIPKGLHTVSMQELAHRILGRKLSHYFLFKQIDAKETGLDYFEIDKTADKIVISASTTSAAANGLNYYLKHELKCYIGPMTQNVSLPDNLPELREKITHSSRFIYRYQMNYCSYGYTFPFWRWEQWEPFLDWVALSGCNLFLNPIGNEAVYRELLIQIGYTRKSADDFLAGPAFLPWQWMMNMTSWGGPIPESRYTDQVELAYRINSRLASMGIGIILPGFAGMVPDDLKDHLPDSQPFQQGTWEGFKRPSILLNTDPNFDNIADMYYSIQKAMINKDISHFYSADPFHEGGNTYSIDLESFANGLLGAMLRSDKDAVWFLQGWQDNPKREMIRNLPKDHVLIANLLAEKNINRNDDFCDSPWLYCTINNFGGQRSLRGNLKNFLLSPYESNESSSHVMAGIGIAPEAITTGEVFFDIFSDIAILNDKPVFEDWIVRYIAYRYGKPSDILTRAWEILANKVYISDIPKYPKESSLCTRPSLTVDAVCGQASNTFITDTAALKYIARLYYSVFDEYSENEPFCFDITDIFRQIISNTGWSYIKEIQQGFLNRDITAFEKAASHFLKLFDLQENLLSTNRHMMLGPWLQYARNNGQTDYEKSLYEFNARTIITLWGDKSGQTSLHDYAAREWSGMILDFYKPRWESYINHLRCALRSGDNANEVDYYAYEYVFTNLNKAYPTNPMGNLREAIEGIINICL